MAEHKIEPCPFCGNQCDCLRHPFNGWVVRCSFFCYQTDDYETSEEAIVAHNTVSRNNAAAPNLVAVLQNALASLHILSLPQLDNTVATNEDIIRVTIDGFRTAIAEAKGVG